MSTSSAAPGDVPALTFHGPHVAELRLRRGERANRLEPRDLATILTHMEAIAARPEIHVLLVSAEGRTFCAGFDLGALMAAGSGSGTKERAKEPGRHGGERDFERAANAIASTRPVTIAIIDGPVVGGGTDIALACDLRIGTGRAKMQMPAAKIGVPLYASALQRYVSRLGLDVAKRLVFLAETIDADEMKRIGLLTELREDADSRARALAAELATLPAKPLTAMKAALNAAATGDATSPEIRAQLDAAYDADEIARRVAAMRAKRG
jgi:enoyl-CoA hydratase